MLSDIEAGNIFTQLLIAFLSPLAGQVADYVLGLVYSDFGHITF